MLVVFLKQISKLCCQSLLPQLLACEERLALCYSDLTVNRLRLPTCTQRSQEETTE